MLTAFRKWLAEMAEISKFKGQFSVSEFRSLEGNFPSPLGPTDVKSWCDFKVVARALLGFPTISTAGDRR
jgi:hypothetical protein